MKRIPSYITGLATVAVLMLAVVPAMAHHTPAHEQTCIGGDGQEYRNENPNGNYTQTESWQCDVSLDYRGVCYNTRDSSTETGNRKSGEFTRTTREASTLCTSRALPNVRVNREPDNPEGN